MELFYWNIISAFGFGKRKLWWEYSQCLRQTMNNKLSLLNNPVLLKCLIFFDPQFVSYFLTNIFTCPFHCNKNRNQKGRKNKNNNNNNNYNINTLKKNKKSWLIFPWATGSAAFWENGRKRSKFYKKNTVFQKRETYQSTAGEILLYRQNSNKYLPC